MSELFYQPHRGGEPLLFRVGYDLVAATVGDKEPVRRLAADILNVGSVNIDASHRQAIRESVKESGSILRTNVHHRPSFIKLVMKPYFDRMIQRVGSRADRIE